MALTEGECQQCRVELGKLKAQYGGAANVPDVAKARLGELESALERECSGSGGSEVGAAVVGLGVLGLGVLGVGLLAALVGSSR